MAQFLIAVTCLGLTTLVSAQSDKTQAEDKIDIDPVAIEGLESMSEYLRTLPAYQVRVTTSEEYVFENGQKATYSGSVNFLVNLPSQLRVETENDRTSRLYLFDGKEFTLFARRVNFYASVPAPSTLGELITNLEQVYGLTIPLIDFYRWSEPDWDPSSITSAIDVGPATVDGITTQQLSLRQNDIDWQIWIQRGDYPLPLKLVITDTTDDARPQYTAEYDWNLAPSFNDAAFAMDPASDAQRVVLENLND